MAQSPIKALSRKKAVRKTLVTYCTLSACGFPSIGIFDSVVEVDNVSGSPILAGIVNQYNVIETDVTVHYFHFIQRFDCYDKINVSIRLITNDRKYSLSKISNVAERSSVKESKLSNRSPQGCITIR